LYAEQGMGDTLQFIRYDRLVRELIPKQVWIEVQPPLIPLLNASSFNNLIPAGEALPETDTRASLLDLPKNLQYHSGHPAN
jgi:hypothetical protein